MQFFLLKLVSRSENCIKVEFYILTKIKYKRKNEENENQERKSNRLDKLNSTILHITKLSETHMIRYKESALKIF